MEDDRRKARKRKVRFHGRVQFKTIRHYKDFLDEEIRASWYHRNDFTTMMEDVDEIADLVIQGVKAIDGEEICTRGLEHLVEEEIADYRAEKMVLSIDAVLDEQEDQRAEDIYDDVGIAKLYSEIAAPLQSEAYTIGLKDALEAQEALALFDDDDHDLLPSPISLPTSPQPPTPSESRRGLRDDDDDFYHDDDDDDKYYDNEDRPRTPSENMEEPLKEDEDEGYYDDYDDIDDMPSADYAEPIEPEPEPQSETKPVVASDAKSTSSSKSGKQKSKSSSSSTKLKKKKTKTKKKSTNANGDTTPMSPEGEKTTKKKKKKEKTKSPSKSSKSPSKEKDKEREGHYLRKTITRKRSSELTNLVRRRDGTFAFKKKDESLRQIEQSEERRNKVRDALFKHIDSEDETESDDYMSKISVDAPVGV